MGGESSLPSLEVIGERIKTIEESLDEAVAHGEMTEEESQDCLLAYIAAFFGEDVV